MFEKGIEKKVAWKKNKSETDKWKFGRMNVVYELHTSRAILEYRTIIHCATRTTLASLSLGATLAFFVFCVP